MHIIEAQQFDLEFLQNLFWDTEEFLNLPDTAPARTKIMATLFYQPSTRTRLSFESAMLRLGGNVISTENAREFSSAIKGETLEDTIRVLSGYCDVIVLRHYEEGAAKRAAQVSDVPIINAGDGQGQHPTQSLVDLFTIYKEMQAIDFTTITFVGDLKSRTVRSLVYLLAKYRDVWMNFVARPESQIESDILEYLTRHNVRFRQNDQLNGDILKETNVIYMTRDQAGNAPAFILNEEWLVNKPDYIIMHPLPRNDEIPLELDKYQQAAYFRQAHYGVPVRMALLNRLLSE